MNFYTTKHKYYCGGDLYGKTLYLCIMDDDNDRTIFCDMTV